MAAVDGDHSSYDNSIAVQFISLEETPLNVLNLNDDSSGTLPNISSLTSNSSTNCVCRYDKAKNINSAINFSVLHFKYSRNLFFPK